MWDAAHSHPAVELHQQGNTAVRYADVDVFRSRAAVSEHVFKADAGPSFAEFVLVVRNHRPGPSFNHWPGGHLCFLIIL